MAQFVQINEHLINLDLIIDIYPFGESYWLDCPFPDKDGVPFEVRLEKTPASDKFYVWLCLQSMKFIDEMEREEDSEDGSENI